MNHASVPVFSLALLLPLAATAGPPSASPPAAPPARCTLTVVNALPGPGGIDPAIQRLRDTLEQPPFNAWHHFKLLSRTEQELKPGGSAIYPAPNGPVTVTYAEHKVHDKQHAVRGALQIESAKVKTNFSLDEGKFFVHAGEKYGGGILIYALSCTTRD